MIKRILYFIRTFPEQVALFVFNSGIFLWISQKGQAISHELGIQQAWENYTPEGVRQFFGNNREAVQAFFSHSAITWLIGSMIILLVIRFVKGVIKWGLFLLVIGIGLFLAYQYSQIASNIPAI